MEITYLGHSCFRLRSGDVSILTDPFPDSLGLALGSPQASAVTVSNDHPNHCNWRAVSGPPRVFNGPGEYEFSGVYIEGFLTPPNPAMRQRNTAYLFEMDGLHILHLGDIAQPLSARLQERLSVAEVLLVPVGAGCTLKLAQVVELIQALNPRIVVPMHYRLPGAQGELLELDSFLKEMGMKAAEFQAKLNVTVSSLPPETRVAPLQPQAQPA